MKKNLYNTNIFFSINNQHLDNYSLPDGALFEDGVKKRTKSNSDYKNQNIKLGLSFPREWGYFGIAFENTDGIYGIPFHAEEEEEEADTFGLDDEDETGRNFAQRAFEKVEKQIVEAYALLSNEEDKQLFYDYLITNLKLYFDRFEEELAATTEEPTTDEYEAEEAAEEDAGEEDLGLGGEDEEELEL